MSDFVSTFLKHTEEYESPHSFWLWAAYGAIAGVLRDNVWIPDGDSKLFPNVYILFLAGSAQRKGRPIGDAEYLVHKVNNVKTISGRSSIQAILTEVGQTETDQNGKLKKGGSAIFFAPELAAGIVQDDQSIQILTDIFDYKPTGHTTNLIGRGKTRLDKLIFSMVAASNEELLKSVYNSKAIHGGLLGRTFLVCPDEFRKSNAFPEGNEKGVEGLVNRLREISLLEGPIEFDWDAREFYRIWYEDFRTKASKRDDRAGVLGRLHTNVKKLSMILAANDLSERIQQKHVEKAIDQVVKLLPNYNSFMFTAGNSTIREAGSIILECLLKAGDNLVDKKVLLRENWQHFDEELMDKTMNAFQTAQLIELQQIGSVIYYKLTSKGFEIMGKVADVRRVDSKGAK